MQFSTTKAVAPVVAKTPLTWEAAYEMSEFCALANERLKKFAAKDSEIHEVINDLTVCDLLKTTESLESIGAKDLEDLAQAMGESVESMKAMSVEQFSEKITAMLPAIDGKAEPSTEVAAELVVAGVYVLFFLTFMIYSYIVAKKMTKYEFWFIDRKPDAILKEKGAKALNEVMIQCFDAKEFTSQIKACKEILDFLGKDVKEIFGEKTKIVDIEKMALKLWSAPTTIVQTSKSVSVGDGWGNIFTDVTEWFDGWINNIPECKVKTLKDHGFTFDSLVNTCKELIDMCEDYAKFGDACANYTNGHYELKKKMQPGFFQRIKLFFTEKKEDREARKQEELILNAKLSACKNLARGYDTCLRMMCNQFFAIAVKTEKYVKADK